MSDDRPTPQTDDDRAGASDEHDDAVIAADDTGMLSGERLITIAEIAQAQSDDAER